MTTRSFACAAFTAALLVSSAAFAGSMPQQQAFDARGGNVMDARGNCVLTQWQSSTATCGQMAQAEAQPKFSMGKEERTVYFDFNKATLKASEKSKLDSLIKAVRGTKDVESVDIVGHTDPIGTSSYNKKLSKKRAETVKKYLAAHGGIKTRNVRVEGLGAQEPAAHCDKGMKRSEQIACLAPDRRVEVEFNMKK